MGSDNLFHRRKARQAESLRPKKARRDSYDTVLIVCEGEKTEPHYIKELRGDLKLNFTNIEITGDTGGSSPMNIVNYALDHYEEYDQTFCVFDKDRHNNYQNLWGQVLKYYFYYFARPDPVPCLYERERCNNNSQVSHPS